MDECDVRFTPYAKGLMRQFALTFDDETLIAAVLKFEPLSGQVVIAGCAALRMISHEAIETGEVFKVSYVYLPNADVQLDGKDIAIVIDISRSNSPSGTGLEPEGILRIIELIAELTRYIIN